MAWIEAHQELLHHPKTRALARALGEPRPHVVGYLMCLWWWCLSYAEDGDLGRYEPDVVADAAEIPGDPVRAVDALVSAGFVDRDGDGHMWVHDWEDYAGGLMEAREGKRAANQTRRANAEQRVRAAIGRIESRGDEPTLTAVQAEAGCGRSTAQSVLRTVRSERSERSGPSGPSGPSRSSPSAVQSEPTVPYRTVPYRTQTQGPGEVAGGPGGMDAAVDAQERPAAPTAFADVSDEAVIETLRDVQGYQRDDTKDQALVASLRAEFPTVDLLKAARGWKVRKLDEPLTPKSKPRAQFRQWVSHEPLYGGNGQARASPQFDPQTHNPEGIPYYAWEPTAEERDKIERGELP